jgi:mono/diheme cytochrome c family protein
MHLKPGPQTSTHGALLLLLISGLLPTLPRADHTITDDRVLRVQDGEVQRKYSVQELINAVGLTELRVAKDPHFGPDRVFAGFALEPLLKHIGLGDASELLLVCEDGYRIPFDATTLGQRPLRGLLALRDTAVPASGGAHWEDYRHGAETINFDPFYLVWAGAYERMAPETEALPWPFQLTEIQRFDREDYYAPARPPAVDDDTLQKGFAIYTAHCGKCHRMRGVGGDVGPVLDRESSLTALLSATQLRDYVRHDENRFPRSKMPPFSKLLQPDEIDQVVAYLQAMQTGR